MGIEHAELVASEDVDGGIVAGLQLHFVVLGDHAREELAVRAHERSQEGRIGVDTEPGEDGHPRVDAGADGIDEGAVEVEDDGVGGVGRRHATVSECMVPSLRRARGLELAWPARAGSVVGRWQAKSRQR